MTNTPTEQRTCAAPDCAQPLTRQPAEDAARFRRRRCCSRGCAVAARRQTRPQMGTPTAAAGSSGLRITEAGIWRPSAPGWPDTPGGRS